MITSLWNDGFKKEWMAIFDRPISIREECR